MRMSFGSSMGVFLQEASEEKLIFLASEKQNHDTVDIG